MNNKKFEEKLKDLILLLKNNQLNPNWEAYQHVLLSSKDYKHIEKMREKLDDAIVKFNNENYDGSWKICHDLCHDFHKIIGRIQIPYEDVLSGKTRGEYSRTLPGKFKFHISELDNALTFVYS